MNVCFHFSWIPNSEIVGSYGNSVFNPSGNFQTVFQCGCTINDFTSEKFLGVPES